MIGPSSRSAGDVVRGGAHQLHAAVEGLVVGLRALEARQERVVDVDRPAGELGAQVVGEHLHVAGQHDQVDAVLLDELAELVLGPGLVSGVTGMCTKSSPWARTSGSASRWLETTAGISICSEPGAVAEQQVVEAVQVLGDHDQGAVRRPRVPQLEGHAELRGDVGEAAAQLLGADHARRRVPGTTKSMRMKNRPVSRSPNCWLSTMLPPWPTRKPETACTTPGRSGQVRTSTKSPDGAVARGVVLDGRERHGGQSPSSARRRTTYSSSSWRTASSSGGGS